LVASDSHSPHAFICDLTLPGVTRTDMSKKVAFNGLDNAEIDFCNVSIPLSNMLSGIASLNLDGTYSLKDPKKPFSFVHVAQRLLSGRICIAGASLSVTRAVIEGVVK
jgi:acyl-CoA oxidase